MREQEAEKERMRKLEEENRRLKEQSKTQAKAPGVQTKAPRVEAVTVTSVTRSPRVKPKALRPPSDEGTPEVVNKAGEVKPVGIK